jgi:hypothetical protein
MIHLLYQLSYAATETRNQDDTGPFREGVKKTLGLRVA